MLSAIKRFINYIRWLYMQYLLNTALYMLEPPEIKLFNFIVLVVIVTAAYSTCVFLPSQMMRLYQWISNNDHGSIEL